MLKAEMIKHLNKQMNLEFYSSNLYLQMSAWCSAHAYQGCATFLRVHANEEHDHMVKLFQYLDDTGNMPMIDKIEAPEHQYESLLDLFEKTYAHERVITESINKLAELAFELKDYSTFNFLQWYVAEQHEEETLFKSILDKINLVGNSGSALYLVDKDIAMLASVK